MTVIIPTERLILRKFCEEDLDTLFFILADEEVMRFSLNGPLKNKEQAKDYFHKRILEHYVQYSYGLYAAINKTDNHLMGFIGLISQCIENEPKTELAYRLLPRYWGQGLATEAALAVCEYAFSQLDIKELISIIDPKNIRSLKVAERVGMKYAKEVSFHNIPVHIYAIQAP